MDVYVLTPTDASESVLVFAHYDDAIGYAEARFGEGYDQIERLSVIDRKHAVEIIRSELDDAA